VSAGSEGRTISLWSILSWLPFVIPVVVMIITGIPAMMAGEIPDFAYVFTDPLVLPAFSLSVAASILVFGFFPGAPRAASDKEPPRSRRIALRAAAAVAVVLGCLVLRVLVIRSAEPTRQAIDAMRRHAVAGPRIGAPVEVGWDVRGWIHASAEVNDEPVPPSIDASVPVRGPRGAGDLIIAGRMVNGRWVFDRVALRLDGGERIDVIKGAPPRAKDAGWEPDPITIAQVGGALAITALLLGGVAAALRGSDPARAIASIEPRPGVPFTLRFVPAATGSFNVWLRFEVEWQEGGEDDYGVTAQVEASVASASRATIELRIGDQAPAIGAEGVRNTTLYRVMSTSSADGYTRRATARLGELKAMPAGGEVVVSGTIAVAPRCATRGLLVFVVPA
jgi:hypothetical protein